MDRLKQLAETNPDNPKFLEDYANALLQGGKLILARKLLQKLHGRLHRADRHDDAYRVVMTHGEWVTGEEGGFRPEWEGPFLRLEKDAKQSFFKRRRIKVREGEALFRTGEAAEKIYLILEGELAITVKSELAGHVLANFVYRGDLVGESALQPNSTRVADVVANKDSTLFEFNREELASAFSKHSDLSELFEEEISLRRKTLILSQCPPFSLLTLSERAIVAEQSIEMDIPNGAIIKKERAHLPYAALLISGEIESYFTADMKPNYSGSLYAKTLFGLGALYLDEAIPHKLVAKKDVKLLKIPHKVVEDASEAHVDFETVVSGIASTNYAQTMETIRILSSNPATN